MAGLCALLAIVVLPGLAVRSARAQDFAPLPQPPAPEPHAPVLTRAPSLKKDATPVYPPDALAAGVTAAVKLWIDIDASGHVAGVGVVEPAGQGFDEAALEAARALEFHPAEIDGRPAAIRIEYVMHFQLRQEPASTPPPAPPAAPAAPPPPPPVILRGRIREKGTREPVVAASVLLIKRQSEAVELGEKPREEGGPAAEVALTDDDGRFELRLGPADAGPHGVRLIVTESNHEPCRRELSAEEIAAAATGRQPPATWECFARVLDATFETRVRATRVTEDVTRHTLTKPELTTVPGTYGDPLRVIQNLPGVARSPYGLGLLIVRGAPPTDTGVFIGGQGIPQLFHFLVGPSVVAPHLIERIDFFPGGFGVRYGRFSGGALDVQLKEGLAEHLHGGMDVSVLDVSAYVEGPLSTAKPTNTPANSGDGAGKDGAGQPETVTTAGTVAVRRSTIDAILPHVIPQRQGSTYLTLVPVYWDYQARAVRDLGRHGRLGLTAFGSDDSIAVVAQDPQAGNTAVTSHSSFHRVVATWTAQGRGWTWRLAPAYGLGEDAFALSGAHGYIRYQRAYLRAELSRPLGARFDARVGFDGLYSYDTAYSDLWFPRAGRNFGNAALERVQISRRLIDWAPAVYVEAEARPTPACRMVPGLRFDAYHVVGIDKYSLDPRLTARCQPSPSWTFKAGAGLYHQLPTGQFLDKEFGNPDLALIWSDQYHVGVERPLTRALTVDATAYFLRRHDLPVPSSEHFSSSGRGRAWGLELWLKHDLTSRFYGWVAYTLSWSEQTGSSADEMLTGTAGGGPGQSNTFNGGGYHPSPYDQRHNLTVVASYRPGAAGAGNWQLGGRYRLVSGRPASAVTGSFYDADFGGYTPEASAAAARLPTFSQLDLRVERTFTFDTWTFGAYLDVQNVLNSKNPESFIYDYRFGARAPVRGLPILPVIGLRGRF